ncbi:MAG TPA: DPP IV N-terminal domain-containing protein, partial [Polyangia bacterium]|nr:DPP IV N-terminal domain-containing protein [Polyangia bacterium]
MWKLTVAILLCASVAGASEPADPFLRDLALTQRFELGNPTNIQPAPDGKAIFFLRAEPRSPVNSLYRFDVATGETKKLLAPEDVLRGAEEKLSAAERQQRERTRQSGRGFVHVQLSRDGKIVLAALSGRLFIVRLSDNDVSELKIAAQPALNPTLSPDATQVAFVHERDLYVYDLRTHKERRLTKSTDPAISNGMAEFVAEEELDRVQGFWWSPDSRQLAFEEADARGVEKLTLPDLAHPERATEGALYPRAGKPNAKVRVGVVAVTGGAPHWLAWDADKLPYLAKVVWTDKAPLTLVLLSRDQKTTQVVAFGSKGGAGKPLVTESDTQFLELDPTVPRWLPDGS